MCIKEQHPRAGQNTQHVLDEQHTRAGRNTERRTVSTKAGNESKQSSSEITENLTLC